MSAWVYRAPLDADGSYARWLRDLRDASGVYVIRTVGGFLSGPECVYIGESHTGSLYKTITRHFQNWDGRRPTYPAGGVTVAVKRCASSRAVDLQYELIQKHKPRDNQVDGRTVAADEEVPF